MLATEVIASNEARQRIVSAELPDGSTVVAFPIALAPGADMLLTRKEVAHLLRLSEGYLRHMGPRLLPVVRLGTSVRHRLSDMIALIESKTVRQADTSNNAADPVEGEAGEPPLRPMARGSSESDWGRPG
jgi:hypothetical protein